MLMKFSRTFFISFVICINLLLRIQGISLRNENTRFEPNPLIEKTVPKVKGYDEMLKAYVYIFNADSTFKTKLVRLTNYKSSFIIYYPQDDGQKLNRKVFTLRKMKFFCGIKTMCKIEDFYSKLNSDDINISDFRDNTSRFQAEIGGNKKCYGEQYTWNANHYGLVVCLEPNDDENDLFKLLDDVNPADYDPNKQGGKPTNTLENRTLKLRITDGNQIDLEKQFHFNNDYVNINSKPVYKYENIEKINDEKCKVMFVGSIIPEKFILLKIYNNKCVVKFVYNKVTTYLGSRSKNCVEEMNYVKSKMTQSCINSIGGPNFEWASQLSSNANIGRWKGYIYFHRLIENGGTLNPKADLVEVDEKGIIVQDEFRSKIAHITYRDIKWKCNDDGGCTIPAYFQYLENIKKQSEINDLKMAVAKIKDTWKIQDHNSCFVIAMKDTYFFCPTDNSEEFNIKTAISVSFDKVLKNAGLKQFNTAQIGEKYNIVYTSDSLNTLAEDDIIVTDKEISTSDGKELINYKKIKEFAGIPCGIDWKNTKLPPSLFEQRPNCCARLKTEENFFFCINPPSKCYKNLREMINLIRKGCMISQGLQDRSILEKNITYPSSWSGEVIMMELDNYGNKGNPKIEKGTMTIGDNVTFAGQKINYIFKIETSNFLCGKGYPCSLDQFINTQKNLLTANLDESWFEDQLNKFKKAIKGTVEESDCYVYVTKHEVEGPSKAIVHCSTDKTQINTMVNSLPAAFAKKVQTIREEDQAYNTLVATYSGRSFKAYVIAGGEAIDLATAKPKLDNIAINQTGLAYSFNNESIFNYEDLIFDAKHQYKLGIDPIVKGITPKLKERNVNKSCCFKAFNQSNNYWFICFAEYPECVFQKSSTVKYIEEQVNKDKQSKKMKDENENIKIKEKQDDNFNFGMELPHKKFDPKFNLGELSQKNFDNSSNGSWSGWGYYGDITDFNVKKINPIFIQIENGVIQIKEDEEKPELVTLNLSNYKSVCDEKPCSPIEYLSYYKKINNYSEQTFLEIAINKFMSQMFRKNKHEACMLLDFESPHEMIQTSHIICSIDPLQGTKLKDSVKNSYYLSTLNLNIDADVRDIYYDLDIFDATLFINEKYIPDFNRFRLSKETLIGTLYDNKTKSEKKDKTDKRFILSYQNIMDEGTNVCAFWYENLRISARGQEIGNQVYDDNACFRFYRAPDSSKVEICLFDYNLRIMTKRMKEMLKGLKSSCVKAKKHLKVTDGKKKEAESTADAFTLATFDDSPNGIWNGYVYISPIFDSSITINTTPFFVKITHNYITLFKSSETNEPFQSIPIDSLEFTCIEKQACSVYNFLSRALKKKKYAPYQNNITTVINSFKDKLPDVKGSFELSCTVLEIIDNGYIMCPYKSEDSPFINHAIVRAFSLNHLSKKISTIPDITPGKLYKINYMQDKLSKKIIYVSQKGIIDKENGTVFIDYPNLDPDPVTKAKCAIWVKEIPVVFETPDPECCFMLSFKKKPVTICLDRKGVCVGDTYRLVKQIWNGCMYGQPRINNLIDPVIDYRIDINPAYRTNEIIPLNDVEVEFEQDMFHDIIYSELRSMYKGWVNIYPIEIDKESNRPVQTLYGLFTPQSFKFYKNKQSLEDKEKEVFSIRPDMLTVICGKKQTCLPMEFVSAYTKKYKSDLSFYKAIVQSRIQIYEIENEAGCSVLEYVVSGKNNYFYVCPHILNVKSENRNLQKKIKSDKFIEARGILSAHYGKLLRKIIYEGSVKSKKYTIEADLPNYEETVKKVKMTFQETRSEQLEILVKDDAVYSASVPLIPFKEMGHCRTRYNLAYAPLDIVLNKKYQCCIRYRGPKYYEYICIDSPNCEVDTYRLALQINNKCKVVKNIIEDDVYNELNAGQSIDTLHYINSIVESSVSIDLKVVSKDGKLSTEELQTKYRSYFHKFFNDGRDLYYEYLIQEVEEGKLILGEEGHGDITPPDDPNKVKDIKSFIPRWQGFTAGKSGKFEVGMARSIRYTNKNESKVIIINNRIFLISSLFKMSFSLKDRHVIIIFKNDKNVQIFLEMIGEEKKIKMYGSIDTTWAGENINDEMDIAEFLKETESSSDTSQDESATQDKNDDSTKDDTSNSDSQQEDNKNGSDKRRRRY